MFKQVRLNDAILKFYQRSQPIAFSNAETLYDDLVLLRDQILMYGGLSEAQTNYLNEFIEKFDNKLTSTTQEILSVWLDDGVLADIVRVAINDEVVDSRDGESNLNLRLNRDKQEITTQLAQTEREISFDSEVYELEAEVSHGNVAPFFKGTDDGVGNFTLLSRTKNLFDSSKITRNALVNTTGLLGANSNYNATDYMWLQAGSYRVSGLTNSALSGTNTYFVVFNSDKSVHSFTVVNTSSPAAFNMPIDGYLRTSLSSLDLETFQIEKGTVTSDYVKGHESTMSIKLGFYDDGTAFKLQKNGEVFDEIKTISGKYARVQRLAQDRSTLSKAKIIFDGENGFSVSDSSLVVDGGRFLNLIGDVLPSVSLKVPNSLGGTVKVDSKNITKVVNELEEVDNKSNTAFNKAGYPQKKILGELGTIHAGGYPISSFSTGTSIKGKEYYLVRNSTHHDTVASTQSKIMVYERGDDGSFNTRVLPLDYSQGDFRDPNLTVDPLGNYLIFTATTYDLTTYKVWLYVFDSELNQVGNEVLMASDVFGWGNTLVTPGGKLIKTAYEPINQQEVVLLTSQNPLPNVGSFTQTPLINASDLEGQLKINETTIAYWGDKLVSLTRVDSQTAGVDRSGLVRSTTDLNGLTGWSDKRLTVRADAPVLQPYNRGDEPLISVISEYSTTINTRTPKIIATADLDRWTSPIPIDRSDLGGGGYATLVRNEHGYGVMYYGEKLGIIGSELAFKDIDLYRYIGNLAYLENRTSSF